MSDCSKQECNLWRSAGEGMKEAQRIVASRTADIGFSAGRRTGRRDGRSRKFEEMSDQGEGVTITWREEAKVANLDEAFGEDVL